MNRLPFYSIASQHDQVRNELHKAIDNVVDGNWYLLGDRLEEFEKAFAAFCEVRYCAGVATGLDAVTLSLKALGIGAGDEVIVPAHTFIATWLAVSAVGARPVPVDPKPGTFNIDPDRLVSAITGKSRAIIPVHLYGHPCNMSVISGIALEHHLNIVEDNAQSHGALHKGQRTGSFGDINATSFYPSKNLGALGDGGAITTNNLELCNRVKLFRNYGSGEKYNHQVLGTNSRLGELQAAVLAVKLRLLEEWNGKRSIIAAQYGRQLIGVGDIITPGISPDNVHVFHLYVIRTRSRDALKAHLDDHGIETMIHYAIPPHLQQAYRHLGYSKGAFPLTEQISNESLSLPLWPGMQGSDVDRVCECISGFFK